MRCAAAFLALVSAQECAGPADVSVGKATIATSGPVALGATVDFTCPEDGFTGNGALICGEERANGFLYYVLSVSWGDCNEQCVVKADERIGTAAVSLEVPGDPPTSLGTGDSVGHGDAVAFTCTDPGVEGTGGAVCENGVFQKTWGGCQKPCSTAGQQVDGATVQLSTATATVADAEAVEFTCTGEGVAGTGALICSDGTLTVSWGGCKAACSTTGVRHGGSDVNLATELASLADSEATEFTCTSEGYAGSGAFVCSDGILTVSWGGCAGDCAQTETSAGRATVAVPNPPVKNGESFTFECPEGSSGQGALICNNGSFDIGWGGCWGACPAGNVSVGQSFVVVPEEVAYEEAYLFECLEPGFTGTGALLCAAKERYQVTWGGCSTGCELDNATLDTGAVVVPFFPAAHQETSAFVCPTGFSPDGGPDADPGELVCKNGTWELAWGGCQPPCPPQELELDGWLIKSPSRILHYEIVEFECKGKNVGNTGGRTGDGAAVCKGGTLAFKPEEDVGWGGCFRTCPPGLEIETGTGATPSLMTHGEMFWFHCKNNYVGEGQVKCVDGAITIEWGGCGIQAISKGLMITVGAAMGSALLFFFTSFAMRHYRKHGCTFKTSGGGASGQKNQKLGRMNSMAAMKAALQTPDMGQAELKSALHDWRDVYTKLLPMLDENNHEQFYLMLARAVVEVMQLKHEDIGFQNKEELLARMSQLLDDAIPPKKRKHVDVNFLRRVIKKFVLRPEDEGADLGMDDWTSVMPMRPQSPRASFGRQRTVRFEDEVDSEEDEVEELELEEDDDQELTEVVVVGFDPCPDSPELEAQPLSPVGVLRSPIPPAAIYSPPVRTPVSPRSPASPGARMWVTDFTPQRYRDEDLVVDDIFSPLLQEGASDKQSDRASDMDMSDMDGLNETKPLKRQRSSKKLKKSLTQEELDHDEELDHKRAKKLKKSKTHDDIEDIDREMREAKKGKLKKSKTHGDMDATFEEQDRDEERRTSDPKAKKLKKSRTHEEEDEERRHSDPKAKKLKKSKTHDDIEDMDREMREPKKEKLKKSKTHGDALEVKEFDEDEEIRWPISSTSSNSKKLKKSRSRGWD
jgi:hypothetical protein